MPFSLQISFFSIESGMPLFSRIGPQVRVVQEKKFVDFLGVSELQNNLFICSHSI
jgi:hypothetical protein